MNKAQACEKPEEWDQALATLAAAIKRYSRLARPLLARARLYRKHGDLDATIADYQSALRLNQRNIDTLTELAGTYVHKGDIPLARAQARKIVAIDRRNTFAQKIPSD